MKAIRVGLYLVTATSLYAACTALSFEQGKAFKLVAVGLGSLATVALALAYYALASTVSRLSHPPGWNLRRFAELCFSKKTFTQVLEPALSDMQKELFEALAASRHWKARMVLGRGYWSFWSAVLTQLPISLVRRIYEVWKSTKAGS